MVSERAQAGSRQNQRRATRGSQGILCPAYNSMMQTLPRAVARGLLFAFLRAVWAGKLDGQAPPSANAMKCAEIAFLPFYTAAPRTRPHPSFHPSARRNARLRELRSAPSRTGLPQKLETFLWDIRKGARARSFAAPGFSAARGMTPTAVTRSSPPSGKLCPTLKIFI